MQVYRQIGISVAEGQAVPFFTVGLCMTAMSLQSEIAPPQRPQFCVIYFFFVYKLN
jgi:hypothetical protein